MKGTFTILLLFILTNPAIAQRYSLDTTLVNNKLSFHISITSTADNLVLLSAAYGAETRLSDTIDNGELSNIELPDYNKDGNSDIILTYTGNSNTYYLYLFDSTENKYKRVDGYDTYPDAVQLKSNPDYYYSFLTGACEGLDWSSYLFKIEEFRSIMVGSLYAYGCDDNLQENPQEIRTFKIKNNNEDYAKGVEHYPYSEGVEKFGDKQHFIEKYWNKYYKQFKW